MDPSEEKIPGKTSLPNKKSKLVIAILAFVSLAAIAAGSFYFYSGQTPTETDQAAPDSVTTEEQKSSEPPTVEEEIIDQSAQADLPLTVSSTEEQNSERLDQKITPTTVDEELAVMPVPLPEFKQKTQATEAISSCDKPTQQLDKFYKHLDSQPYMAGFKLNTTSKSHFSALSKKLLANPPYVTRESDDLYTILKNTAHFFRVSDKNNILMMKGILDNEKGSIEEILSSYYFLLTTPDCSMTTYARGIDRDALYEYACFFLNTMGGRLYLFRRDSLSRMVVTYYAILLVDLANTENNNRHGIALKTPVNMLIAEMETGGSALKQSETYLDKLYDLKEKYQ